MYTTYYPIRVIEQRIEVFLRKSGNPLCLFSIKLHEKLNKNITQSIVTFFKKNPSSNSATTQVMYYGEILPFTPNKGG